MEGSYGGTPAVVAQIQMGHEFGYAKLEASVAQALEGAVRVWQPSP